MVPRQSLSGAGNLHETLSAGDRIKYYSPHFGAELNPISILVHKVEVEPAVRVDLADGYSLEASHRVCKRYDNGRYTRGSLLTDRVISLTVLVGLLH